MKPQVTNFLLPVLILMLIVVICLMCVFYMKLSALEKGLSERALSKDVDQKFQELAEKNFTEKNSLARSLVEAIGRIEALEAGKVEKEVEGPKTPDFLFAELERQLNLKRTASYSPDDEKAAQERIEAVIDDLLTLQQEGADIITLLIERIKVNRDPNIRAALIRDVAWRFGPKASPALMTLFRDKEFTSNLRVLAAISAFRCSGKDRMLLEEFTQHLGDPKEYLVIKTGLVSGIFRDNPYEGAVDLLIEGAKSANFPINHRTECLRALGQYDHPKVLRALEEILFRKEEDPYIVNFAIQAYHSLMREKSVPFFKKLLDEGRADQNNKAKIQEILKKYS